VWTKSKAFRPLHLSKSVGPLRPPPWIAPRLATNPFRLLKIECVNWLSDNYRWLARRNWWRGNSSSHWFSVQVALRNPRAEQAGTLAAESSSFAISPVASGSGIAQTVNAPNRARQTSDKQSAKAVWTSFGNTTPQAQQSAKHEIHRAVFGMRTEIQFHTVHDVGKAQKFANSFDLCRTHGGWTQV